MHVTDIQTAVANNEWRRTQDGFRALVDYPNEDTIIGNPKKLGAALEQCCNALLNDASILPGRIRELIEERTGMEVGTYDDGARVVLANKGEWQAIFKQHAGV